jgi:predicted nuclease of restriction endonuclease-like (RecB) superfamily
MAFPIRHALRDELSWTHYRLLLKVEKETARDYYLQEAVRASWSTRELERQINSLLYERLLLSRNKNRARELAAEGQIVRTARDLIKDPYVLEFLGVQDSPIVQEKDLEQRLMDRLREFLLELGKGFAFVARQKRITVDGDPFYIDLVFYNYLLKCFVLIDLKFGKLTYHDTGQMDFYTRYFEQEEKTPGDNPTLGLILCSDKSDAMVRYTLLADSQQIFASRYRLHLPTEAELEQQLREERAQIEQEQRLLSAAPVSGLPDPERGDEGQDR